MSKGLRRRPLEMTRRDWRAWGRDLLRRCAERENNLRKQFLPPEFGLHDLDAVDDINAQEVRQQIEAWTFGNIAARRDFLRAHQARERATRPVQDDLAEVDAICTLLFEASQDGESLGPDNGSAWVGALGARSWAERIKSVMREVAALRSAAFPDEDPESLAGPYGDGFDALLEALARLTEERDEALEQRAEAIGEVARLEARWADHIRRSKWEEERTCMLADGFDPCGECEACLLRDAELSGATETPPEAPSRGDLIESGLSTAKRAPEAEADAESRPNDAGRGRFRVWDALNGDGDEDGEHRFIDADTPSEAAEAYAEQDRDGLTDGLYTTAHPIVVREPNGIEHRFNVSAETVLTFHAVGSDQESDRCTDLSTTHQEQHRDQ